MSLISSHPVGRDVERPVKTEEIAQVGEIVFNSVQRSFPVDPVIIFQIRDQLFEADLILVRNEAPNADFSQPSFEQPARLRFALRSGGFPNFISMMVKRYPPRCSAFKRPS